MLLYSLAMVMYVYMNTESSVRVREGQSVRYWVGCVYLTLIAESSELASLYDIERAFYQPVCVPVFVATLVSTVSFLLPVSVDCLFVFLSALLFLVFFLVLFVVLVFLRLPLPLFAAPSTFCGCLLDGVGA